MIGTALTTTVLAAALLGPGLFDTPAQDQAPQRREAVVQIEREIVQTHRRLDEARREGAERRIHELELRLENLHHQLRGLCHSPETDRDARIRELEHALAETERRHAEAREAGARERVRELERHFDELSHRLHEIRAGAQDRAVHRDPPRNRTEIEWRIHHLEQAANQLREGGMPDFADRVAQHREELVREWHARNRAEPDRPHCPCLAGMERIEELEAAVRELRHAVAELREAVRQISQRLEKERVELR